MYLRFRVISCPKVVNRVVIPLMWAAITSARFTKKRNKFEIKALWKYAAIEWETSNSNGLVHWVNINAYNSIRYYIEIDYLISMAIGNESWFIWFFQFGSTNRPFDVDITVFSGCSPIVCHRWQKRMAQIYYMAAISMPPTIFAKFFFLDAYNSILLRSFGWLSSVFFFKSILSFRSFVFINVYLHGSWNYGKVNVISRDIEKSGAKQWNAKRKEVIITNCRVVVATAARTSVL